MQNFINFHGDDYSNGTLYLPARDGKVSWVDMRDIGAVNLRVLLSPEDYRSQTLVITGPEALSYADVVAVMNNALGKSTTYVSVTDEDAINAMTELGFPEFQIKLMIDLNQCIREGFSEEITTTVKDITGKDPITFQQFLQDNKQAWL